jgi:hypothetical protein
MWIFIYTDLVFCNLMTEHQKEMLEYYFEDGPHVVFEKYTIDTLGIIRNVKSGEMPTYGNRTYNECTVYDNNGKTHGIHVSRAVASTFLGKPPTPEHTADHIKSDEKRNDKLTNIRWLCKSGQSTNQTRPKTYKVASVIINNDIEKTAKEWVDYLNKIKKPTERDYTDGMILKYAQKKQHGFSYKEYMDLEGEVWKLINESETWKGRWEISNMNRVKYVTNHVSNVLWGDRLGRDKNGYPIIKINGKHKSCHILAFKMFYPGDYETKKSEEMVLHYNDDKEDFRPHNLRLGTLHDNGKDAHDNGKYNGKKSARMKCVSYINGKFEKEHKSQRDAAAYIKSKGCSIANLISIQGSINNALSAFCNGKVLTRYERTWKLIDD